MCAQSWYIQDYMLEKCLFMCVGWHLMVFHPCHCKALSYHEETVVMMRFNHFLMMFMFPFLCSVPGATAAVPASGAAQRELHRGGGRVSVRPFHRLSRHRDYRRVPGAIRPRSVRWRQTFSFHFPFARLFVFFFLVSAGVLLVCCSCATWIFFCVSALRKLHIILSCLNVFICISTELEQLYFTSKVRTLL